MPFRDARVYQILFLSLFLLVGVGTRDWSLQPGMVVVAIATCLVTQVAGLLVVGQWSWGQGTGAEPETEAKSQEPNGYFSAISGFLPANFSSALAQLLSPLITSLGMSLLLRADHYGTVMIATTAAILSKFLIRINGKHVFNPGNFGIVTALVLLPDAWVSPGQWGESGWYALLFLGAGGVVLRQVGRWDTTVAFLGSYAALEAIRNLWLGWTWDVWLHRLMSGSLLLFALFMVTDPRTIPNARNGRLIWAIAIAVLTFILRNVFFVPTAVFWALFALAPLTLLIDWVLPSDRFIWVRSAESSARLSEGAALSQESLV